MNIAEKAILVGLITPLQNAQSVEDYLKELSFLVETAGAQPIKTVVQKLATPDTKTYVGSGKLEEIAEYVSASEADLVVFDDELSASQTRNIERVLGCKIIDRPMLILDIFARHARTTTAKTQVELAQYEYLLPRLTRMWTHLEKQRGGIGMRGPGEKEIETDRRIIRDKIALLKEKLKSIDKQKVTQRKSRSEHIRVALVGYTNAGKSTIMNMLSKSDVYVENKLFATLDTTVRKVVVDTVPFLLSDTVGFIRKLPHRLVESFKSTLDEVREADLLIHVVDISHASFEEQIDVVKSTLEEIGCGQKPMITVFNKIDNYSFTEKDADDLTPATKENLSLEDLKKTWYAEISEPAVFISALQKSNIEEFREIIFAKVTDLYKKKYPYSTGSWLGNYFVDEN